jgi:hypothetical protein
MTKDDKPEHPKFGAFLADSLRADGKGGSLSEAQYKELLRKQRELTAEEKEIMRRVKDGTQ